MLNIESFVENVNILFKLAPKRISFVVILSTITAIVEALLLKNIALFIEYLSNNTSTSLINIKNISIELFLIALLSGILRIYLTWYLPYVSTFLTAKLGRKIAYDLTKVDPIALETYTKEELTDTLTTQISIASLAIRQGLQCFYYVLTQATLMITAFYLAPEIMISSISIIIVFYILFYKSISSKVNNLSIAISDANISLLSQTLSLINELVGYSLNPKPKKIQIDIDKSLNLLKDTEVSSAFLTTFPRYAIESIGIMLIAIVPFIVFNDTGETLSIATIFTDLGVFAYSVQKLLPNSQGIYSCITDIKTKEVSLSRVIRLYKLTSKYSRRINIEKIIPYQIHQINISKGLVQPPLNNAISINADFSISKGDSIALIGPTGSGKTTIIKTLIGSYPLKKGELKVNNKTIVRYSEDYFNYRSSIAYVAQNSRIIQGGLIENITLEIDPKLINYDFYEKCCKIASINISLKKKLEDINDLKYGKNLSGGQIQRIAIARAIYQNLSILVLDESTSALDQNTQELVLESIKEFYKEKILIKITHRLETLKIFNRVLEIRDYRVNELKPKEFYGL